MSDRYEYTLHEDAEQTLQVFVNWTLSSLYFSPKQSLDLLDFLAAHKPTLERLANAAPPDLNQPKQTIREEIFFFT